MSTNETSGLAASCVSANDGRRSVERSETIVFRLFKSGPTHCWRLTVAGLSAGARRQHPRKLLITLLGERYRHRVRAIVSRTNIHVDARYPSMNLRPWARDNVGSLTAVLSVVSLTLVFGAALQQLPTAALPRIEPLLDVIPHLNAVLSSAAIVTILAGVRAIRRGNVRRHRALMIGSFLLFSGFLALYLYRVALLGPSEFPGPAVVRMYVYLPFLFVHIALAVLCIPFVFYALLSAGTRPVSEVYGTRHARVGRLAAALWLISFSMGLIIYALLYHVY